MATKIKKGTEVYEIADWDGSHTVYVRKLLITSFGKIQGTGVRMENGINVEYRLYANEEGKTLFPVADVADINEFALQRAVDVKAKWTKYRRDLAHGSHDVSGDAYLISIASDARVQLEQTPAVIFR